MTLITSTNARGIRFLSVIGCFLGLVSIACPTHASLVSIPTVVVDNPGNGHDPLTGGVFGGVAYTYRIAAHEVTIRQYTAFLNAVAATDTFGLYNANMATDPNSAGIARSGSSGSFSYTPIGSPNRPITYVDWLDAARFANWMHNGQPVGAQNASTTEDGAYDLVTPVPAPTFINRRPGAQWFLPSEGEWYKAAYHKDDGVTNNYWLYPTQSNTRPFSVESPGAGTPNPANNANYVFNDGNVNTPYDDGFAVGPNVVGGFVVNANYLSDAGAYTATTSPYGTYDQAGNVFEWTEGLDPSSATHPGSSRITRGGSWFTNMNALRPNHRNLRVPHFIDDQTGFRLAAIVSVPEPSSFALAISACAVLWLARRHLRGNGS